MATNGGARPGAGRPKGAKNAVVSVPQSTRKTLQDAMVERLKDLDVTPLEVMMTDMKLQYDETRRLLANVETLPEKSKAEQELKARAMAAVRTSSSAAAASAEKVAPYIHQKLQAVTLRGDKQNPLEIALGLVDAAELRKKIRGE